MKTKIIKYAFIFFILIGAYIAISGKSNYFFSFLTRKQIFISDTNLVIEETKKMAQLFSTKYYAEIVIDSTKYVKKEKIKLVKSFFYLSKVTQKDSVKQSIVLTAEGNCYVGTDLNKIEIVNENDDFDCHLLIPNAEIFNTVINPSNFKVFYEKGEWSPEDVQLIKSSAIRKLEQVALKNGIIDKANKRTIILLKEFIQSLGYKKVKIEVINENRGILMKNNPKNQDNMTIDKQIN